jgi:hypothetical protein
MMALVAADRTDAVVAAMNDAYFAPRCIQPNHVVAVPSPGASIV